MSSNRHEQAHNTILRNGRVEEIEPVRSVKKMMTNLNVLCLRVLNWVVSNLDGTLIVTEQRH